MSAESKEDRAEKAKALFEKRITAQERLIQETAYQFEDESQEDFDTKVARRTRLVVVGLGHARTVPYINAICPGQDATWQGYRINRRRVDQLDNVYVSRSRK